MVRVSIRISWVVNFALFRCYRPVIYTRPHNGYHSMAKGRVDQSGWLKLNSIMLAGSELVADRFEAKFHYAT